MGADDMRDVMIVCIAIVVFVIVTSISMMLPESQESHTVYEGIFVDMETSAGGFLQPNMINIHFENSSLTCKMSGSDTVFMQKGQFYRVTVSARGFLKSYEEVRE